jgi:hypothetical protein
MYFWGLLVRSVVVEGHLDLIRKINFEENLLSLETELNSQVFTFCFSARAYMSVMVKRALRYSVLWFAHGGVALTACVFFFKFKECK